MEANLEILKEQLQSAYTGRGIIVSAGVGTIAVSALMVPYSVIKLWNDAASRCSKIIWAASMGGLSSLPAVMGVYSITQRNVGIDKAKRIIAEAEDRLEKKRSELQQIEAAIEDSAS